MNKEKNDETGALEEAGFNAAVIVRSSATITAPFKPRFVVSAETTFAYCVFKL
jgi:hypothetical protein